MVTMVMLHGDVVAGRKALEGLFGLNGVVGRCGGLGMDIVQPGGVVHEDGGDVVPLMFEFPSGLCDEAGDLGDELIDGDNIAGFKLGLGEMTWGLGAAPRLAFGFAKEATCTLGDAAMSHACWEDALLGGLLDSVHWEMSKFEVIAHEEVFCLHLKGRR